MKMVNRHVCVTAVIILFLIFAPLSYAGWGDLLKDIQETLGISTTGGVLSQNKIGNGLKEALRIGAENAVKKVSILDGYYGNPEIRIPLPDSVFKVEKVIRTFGYGSQVDAFTESMNRAAEKAAPAARDLFWEAVKGMTFEDATKILKGRDNEATLYLKDKTWDNLLETFKPIVNQAMGSVGVTKQYQDLENMVRNIPVIGQSLGVDIDNYVSEKALNGLFMMLEKEEQKIREDPAARVTDLLKEVFGGNR